MTNQYLIEKFIGSIFDDIVLKEDYKEEDDISEGYLVRCYSIFHVKNEGWYVGENTYKPSYNREIQDDYDFSELNEKPLNLSQALNLLCKSLFNNHLSLANENFMHAWGEAIL